MTADAGREFLTQRSERRCADSMRDNPRFDEETLVSGNDGLLRVAADTTLSADIRNCRRLEVLGAIDGDVVADEVVVHEGGRLSGRLRTNAADVMGVVEGDVIVRDLIAIRANGSVSGDVRYGRMSLEPGGELTAKVKNVPPELVGDFSVSVRRGHHIVITSEDVAAVDPDNAAHELVYTPSDVRGGHLALVSDTTRPVTSFTQADLNEKRVVFVHNGGPDRAARFDIVVHDAEGASSGKPRTVDVTVVDGAGA